MLHLLPRVLDDVRQGLTVVKAHFLVFLYAICASVSCDIHDELLIAPCLKESHCSCPSERVVCFVAFHTNLSTQLLHSRGDLVVAYWLF